MRYRISFNLPSKIIMGLLGMGPSRSWVEIGPEEIRGQIGWGGSVTIPRKDIASVERPDRNPWWAGFGIHGGFGTWVLNGSMSGMVKITMKRPAKGLMIIFPIKPETVYFSLEQPEEFIHEANNDPESVA